MSKSTKSILGGALFSAITAFLCCITPVLAMLSGISRIASAFSWLDLLRPYFLTLTVVLLRFSWLQILKNTKKQSDCACEEEGGKKGFLRTKAFLVIITVAAIALSAFPYYSKVFFKAQEAEEAVLEPSGEVKKILVNCLRINLPGV